MLSYIKDNPSAIIVLHEIYGINAFIKDVCRQYHEEGYDVYCPNLRGGEGAFPYADTQAAYASFKENVGFTAYLQINALIHDLKMRYQTVVVTGFSVGATIAWLCSESAYCDGALCCYGSRIRDYVSVTPKCPALLIFAKEDAFDVARVCAQLRTKERVIVEIMDAGHGFVDPYAKRYAADQARDFHARRREFFAVCTKRAAAN